MSYAIVYSSRTGNTALLAQTIQNTLPQEECCYFGTPSQDALSGEVLYVGFWTDKGTCDESTALFLQSLTNQKVFLFGTAGFGGSIAYFEQILNRVKENLSSSVQVVGTYMCQGKMPQVVRDRYAAMEDSPKRTMMLENFDQALSHPDQKDLMELKKAVTCVPSMENL